jgi:AcrR family transcriptional regulator
MKEGSNEQPAPLRRRGDVLLQAIYAAVLAEVAEVGFGRLTMEGIAERAHTGKMSLYRRWDSLQDLVLDALNSALEESRSEVPDTGNLREDLIELLKGVRRIMSGPVGPALIAITGKGQHHPDLLAAIREKVIAPHSQILQILERGVARGEINREMISPQAYRVGKEMVIIHHFMHGVPPDDAEIAAIVDRVVLPALGVRG